MAVMDFREGGYVFSRHKVKREFSYDQANWRGDGAAGDAEYPAGAGPDGIGTRVARLTHYVGAVASVGLMIGLMAWGWELVSRDVSGVPVIRAIQGESRTTPENPGGQLTNHTGLAVNSVAAGEQAGAPSQVAIAPAATDLAEDDVAMGQLGATAREPANPSETQLNFDGEPVVPMSDAEARALAQAEAAQAAERALADQAVNEAAIIDAPASEGPVTAVVTDETGAPAQATAIAEALAQAQAEASPGVLVASTRPAPRPRTTRVAAVTPTTRTDASPAPAPAVAAERPAPEPAAQPVAAATASGPVVQVGAFDSDAIAQGEWQRLAGRNSGLFSGKSPVIQQHQSNGRTFWRLRVAGFGSLSQAREFCSALKSSGTDCLALN
ncbi:SPOR domain-containing protein [Paracoccus sp. 1_MG-2023]|uniref:SPOR domain-containing protein n=1 Tax=unclassified Paracoccus (in: a-proteobacteria) TaxID=2688777 RepID=UPI001C0824D8|nr:MULTISPECIES: SPOR domain-containing protein [unclassified Paracoccus (in: a-proteobacteria)]MBU2956454.1 SPOR domain-containing protein [Paracoccus sp. C2R09]MDO6669742.1 SPOR domain-containing protein [Paracoccus sp. 1_MG-2023]